MTLEAPLHIDGNVEGSIESSADVSVGESGSFEGTLRAQHIVVSGYINGRLDCERLEIVSNGKVLGEVVSNEFIIESGGQFVGESHVKDQQPVARIAPAAAGEDDEAALENIAEQVREA